MSDVLLDTLKLKVPGHMIAFVEDCHRQSLQVCSVSSRQFSAGIVLTKFVSDFKSCLILSEYAWSSFWSCLIVSEHVWTCLNMSDHVYSCLIKVTKNPPQQQQQSKMYTLRYTWVYSRVKTSLFYTKMSLKILKKIYRKPVFLPSNLL
jgi:hypothetical protein